MKVVLLTGGKDAPYARGLVRELAARDIRVVLIGHAELAAAADEGNGRVDFRNMVGSLDPGDGLLTKVWRVFSYYTRLVAFAARTDERLFHILWFRKFPVAERLILIAYLKLLGKKLLFTAHNVDDQARNGKRGTFVNKLSLTFLYKTVDHIFVHTPKMKLELVKAFGVSAHNVTVVPFGINDVVPVAGANRSEARRQLGLRLDQKILLFFGTIAPYKGIEDLLRALASLVQEDDRFILILAGPVKDRTCEPYWASLQRLIDELHLTPYIRREIRYIPDRDVGLLFKAADVSVLPYRRIYQSGVLALSYAQGVPVIAADIGSISEDMLEHKTGLLFRSGDVADLAAKIRSYFASELFQHRETRERYISDYGIQRFSWATNADRTRAAYKHLLVDSAHPAPHLPSNS